MKLLPIVRSKVASLAGMDGPTASEILHVGIKERMPSVDAACGDLDPPVLRHATLSDVELRHDLEARGHGRA
jgi:hypothetical protein